MKMTKSRLIFRGFNALILVLIAFFCCYPMLYVLFASFSQPELLMAHDGLLLAPLGFTLKGYQLVLQKGDIYMGYVNTIVYVVCGTSLSIFLTVIAGYCLSRKDVLWNSFFMKMITVTMFFGGGMIPQFLLVLNLGMIDTRLSMILPTALSAYNIIIMRTAITGAGESLVEAAKIDGANEFTTLFRIIVPVVMPTIAVLILFYAFAKWNSWFEPMIYLRSRKLFPLQTFLRELLISEDTKRLNDDGMMKDMFESQMNKELLQYSTVIVSTVPMLCIYPFLQKYFTKGVMIGAVKE